MSVIERNQIDEFFGAEFADARPEYIGEGWSSFAFRIGDNIIRVPRDTEYIAEYERDAAICEFVRPFVNVQVPKIKVIRGKIAYAEHCEIKGKTWDNAYIFSLSGREQDVFAADFARFLSQCHAIDCDVANKAIPGLRTTTDGGLDLEKCAMAFDGFLPAPQIDKMISKYADASEKKDKDVVFCHCDFSIRNAVLDQCGRLCGIIDWGGAGIVTPAYDFTRFYNPEEPVLFNKMALEYESACGRKITEESVARECLMSNVGAAYWLNEDKCLAPIREREMNKWIIRSVQKHIL